MVRNKIFALIGAVLLSGSSMAYGQENQVKRIPKKGGSDETTMSITDFNKGFWCAVEASVGASVRFGKGKDSNAGFGEADFIFGYRGSEHFMIGPGVGVRYYFPNDHLRRERSNFSFPIFLDIRGNFLSHAYRNIVPYYSIDAGAAIRDGVFWRPTVGMRFGSNRNAFMLGISYTGQMMKVIGEEGRGYISFVSVKFGYQF